ncbi:MAG: hypothetical protein HRU20_25225 [Pseudomonadales bacterium]|nr:hypothetical protein [Pseudomonadales bacterium]
MKAAYALLVGLMFSIFLSACDSETVVDNTDIAPSTEKAQWDENNWDDSAWQ